MIGRVVVEADRGSGAACIACLSNNCPCNNCFDLQWKKFMTMFTFSIFKFLYINMVKQYNVTQVVVIRLSYRLGMGITAVKTKKLLKLLD